MRSVLFILPAVVLLLGGDDLSRREAKKLEGTWAPVSSERNGKVRPEASRKQRDVRLVFQGETFALTAGGKDEAKGTIRLTPSKKPKAIDLIVVGPDGKGVTIPGIYELEGDKLTLATGLPGRERPAAFKTKEGSDQETSVYKRVQK